MKIIKNKLLHYLFLITTIFIVSGCSNGKLRLGEPRNNGTIQYIEKNLPGAAGGMTDSGPISILNLREDIFLKLKEYCEEKNYTFENPLLSMGWCIDKGSIPVFVFYDSLYGMSIYERSAEGTEEEWIAYTKNRFGILWVMSNVMNSN
ncbi:hypothetical protein PWM41_000232 [Providencia rettgeri]|uniref:hypothetical protein n=1 Tax=Providencia TaxID=586 RepID=UPI001B37E2C5|nr:MULTISPECIES: hypothetical protein [Providencia]EMB5784715.1 hypothetical protein [Providencia rettgeri]MBQ0366165.1 hypothetical protein [Providencia rettgeri]MDK7743486.1 hypothetical protein [Providencia rettgeri]MDK7756328.1 hypothetical protein [Providencia rettgeri]